MLLKSLGKASMDVETELWSGLFSKETFLMNPRLVDTRADIKDLRKKYKKIAQTRTPPFRKQEDRKKYYSDRQKSLHELHEGIKKVYDEILQDSFQFPIPLRLSQGYSHRSDWRYCIFKSIVYQFDRPGYTDDEMIHQIRAWETQKGIV